MPELVEPRVAVRASFCAQPADGFFMTAARAPEHSLKCRERLISCPTFVCTTEVDGLSSYAGLRPLR